MRRATGWGVLATAAALACSSRAHALDGAAGAEVGIGQSQQGVAIPASTYEYQRLTGRMDLTDSTSLSATLRLTRDFAPGAEATTSLRTGADWVWLGTLDLSHDLSDHVTLAASVTGSPPSSRDVVGSLDWVSGGAAGASTASLVHATNANGGGSIDLTYDSFSVDGPSHPFDVSIDASVGYAWFGTQQSLTAIDATAPGLPAACAGPSASGCTRPSPTASDALSQVRLEGSLTGTLAEKTDLGVDAAAYVYGSDPSTAGFFESDMVDAKGTSLGRAAWGVGAPLLPPRWTLRPELARRIGSVSLRAYYQYTDYAIDGWSGHTVGGKPQVRLGAWKLYATGYYRWDDEAGVRATAWTLGLGVACDL